MCSTQHQVVVAFWVNRAYSVRINDFSRTGHERCDTRTPIVWRSECIDSADVCRLECQDHGLSTTAVHFRTFLSRIIPRCLKYLRGVSIGNSTCVKFSMSDELSVSDQRLRASNCPRNCLQTTTVRCCRFPTSQENSFEESGHALNCRWNRLCSIKTL